MTIEQIIAYVSLLLLVIAALRDTRTSKSKIQADIIDASGKLSETIDRLSHHVNEQDTEIRELKKQIDILLIDKNEYRKQISILLISKSELEGRVTTHERKIAEWARGISILINQLGDLNAVPKWRPPTGDLNK